MDTEKINSSEIIENLVSECFKDSTTQNLSEIGTKMLIMAIAVENTNIDMPDELPKYIDESFTCQMLKKRIEIYKFPFEINDTAMIVIEQMTQGNAGNNMTALAIIAKWAKDNKTKMITATNIAEEIFPYGFYSNESLEKFWIEQKVPEWVKKSVPTLSDNMVDYPQFWQSLTEWK